jgi:hypothetical protein
MLAVASHAVEGHVSRGLRRSARRLPRTLPEGANWAGRHSDDCHDHECAVAERFSLVSWGFSAPAGPARTRWLDCAGLSGVWLSITRAWRMHTHPTCRG